VGLLQRAADQGSAEAQYLLASLYRKGRGVVADDIRATQLLRQAGENRLLAAEIEYAIALFNGKGVHKDEAGAARLFLKAALDGNAVAQNRLARLLTIGRGVKQNHIEAAGWHLLASGQGLEDAWLDEALKGLTPADRSKAEAFAARHRDPLIGPAQ
jgi:TPR repeat protein